MLLPPDNAVFPMQALTLSFDATLLFLSSALHVCYFLASLAAIKS